ncbi:MAG: YgjV family protein [Terracidiphilus sp.]|nr:YgjV family protein [Terracidiphilus sp.]
MVQIFSPAQCAGYVAFAVGVTAFLQKSDRRLKFFNGAECLVYAAHFTLLGNLSAAMSALISGTRSLTALKTRAPLLAVLFIVLNLALGLVFAKTAAGWLPIAASCLATVAIFFMQGIRMRLLLLVSTFLWLANNIVSGSIGGTALECVIATANIVTMVRMQAWNSERQSGPAPAKH